VVLLVVIVALGLVALGSRAVGPGSDARAQEFEHRAFAPGVARDGPLPEPETLSLNVYFLRDEQVASVHREVEATLAVARAAMEELLAGPTEFEAETGIVSAIPEGTEFLGVSVEDGIASVDLSGEYESGGGSLSVLARLAQVTYTLTQFPTVDAVIYFLDGERVEVFSGEGVVLEEPVGRGDFENVTPAIFVDEPSQGETIASPIRVTGTANTFEAVFHLNIVDADGLIIVDEVAMATSGSGTRGTFDVTIPFAVESEQRGAIIVFELSAQDGSQVNVVEIPLTLQP
jgi:hypothetical protein